MNMDLQKIRIFLDARGEFFPPVVTTTEDAVVMHITRWVSAAKMTAVHTFPLGSDTDQAMLDAYNEMYPYYSSIGWTFPAGNDVAQQAQQAPQEAMPIPMQAPPAYTPPPPMPSVPPKPPKPAPKPPVIKAEAVVEPAVEAVVEPVVEAATATGEKPPRAVVTTKTGETIVKPHLEPIVPFVADVIDTKKSLLGQVEPRPFIPMVGEPRPAKYISDCLDNAFRTLLNHLVDAKHMGSIGTERAVFLLKAKLEAMGYRPKDSGLRHSEMFKQYADHAEAHHLLIWALRYKYDAAIDFPGSELLPPMTIRTHLNANAFIAEVLADSGREDWMKKFFDLHDSVMSKITPDQLELAQAQIRGALFERVPELWIPPKVPGGHPRIKPLAERVLVPDELWQKGIGVLEEAKRGAASIFGQTPPNFVDHVVPKSIALN
jgi:hypothetical protein